MPRATSKEDARFKNTISASQVLARALGGPDVHSPSVHARGLRGAQLRPNRPRTRSAAIPALRLGTGGSRTIAILEDNLGGRLELGKAGPRIVGSSGFRVDSASGLC